MRIEGVTMESGYLEKVGRERAATRHRRQIRQRRDRKDKENWTRGGLHHETMRAHSPISDELDANPNDAARLQKSRQQAREGKGRFWRPKDEGEKKKSDAGE
jgi:hypothetical protein